MTLENLRFELRWAKDKLKQLNSTTGRYNIPTSSRTYNYWVKRIEKFERLIKESKGKVLSNYDDIYNKSWRG